MKPAQGCFSLRTGFPAEKSLITDVDLWKVADTDRCSNLSATTDCHDPCRSAHETLQGSRQSLWHRMLVFTLRTVLRRARHGHIKLHMALRSAVKSSLLIFRGSLLLSLVASLSTLRIAPRLMCVGLGRSLLAAAIPLAGRRHSSCPFLSTSPPKPSLAAIASGSLPGKQQQQSPPLPVLVPLEELECILDLNAPLMTIEEGEESPEDLQAGEDY
eukprot:g2657.t1